MTSFLSKNKETAMVGPITNACTGHQNLVRNSWIGQYTDEKMIKIRQKACKNAGKILGISKFYFFDFPDMRLDTIPHIEINQKLETKVKERTNDLEQKYMELLLSSNKLEELDNTKEQFLKIRKNVRRFSCECFQVYFSNP